MLEHWNFSLYTSQHYEINIQLFETLLQHVHAMMFKRPSYLYIYYGTWALTSNYYKYTRFGSKYGWGTQNECFILYSLRPLT
jgi:hypothetical protein